MQIGERLKELRKKKNIKMPAIAKATGISKENLYKWEKGTKPSDIEQYNKLVDYLDKMEKGVDLILEDPKGNGSGKTSASRSFLTGIFISQDEESLPLADEHGMPGDIIVINDKPVLIARRNDSLFIGEVDGLIPVNDDSMEPKCKSGSWIALKKVRYTKILNAGYYYYIVDKNMKGIVRKIHPGAEKNSIVLVAENEEYPEMTREMDEILAFFKIEATVTRQ